MHYFNVHSNRFGSDLDLLELLGWLGVDDPGSSDQLESLGTISVCVFHLQTKAAPLMSVTGQVKETGRVDSDIKVFSWLRIGADLDGRLTGKDESSEQ